MAKVIIFGTKDLAELAYYYLKNDTKHEIVAFSVHQEYIRNDREFCGLPLVAFDNIEQQFNPKDYMFFAPITHKKMNKVREGIYNQIKNKGYQLLSYVSSKATVLTDKIGDNCFILEDNTIQPFVVIGNNVVLWSGNHIGHHSIIENHIFFTSHVVLSGHCIVKPYCFLGVNSTIRDGIILAEGTFVAMGTTITKNTEAYSVYIGNPPQKNIISSLNLKF